MRGMSPSLRGPLLGFSAAFLLLEFPWFFWVNLMNSFYRSALYIVNPPILVGHTQKTTLLYSQNFHRLSFTLQPAKPSPHTLQNSRPTSEPHEGTRLHQSNESHIKEYNKTHTQKRFSILQFLIKRRPPFFLFTYIDKHRPE